MPVAQSSHVQRYEYDRENGSLLVEFVNGAQYMVSNFPEYEYHNFHQSGSKGSYWHSKIRPNYNVTRVMNGMSRERARDERRSRRR